MQNNIYRLIPGLVIMFFSIWLSGCASVPSITVWRPYSAVMKSSEDINPRSRLKINVNGETPPLLGNENLRLDSLNTITKNLLKRRGFIIADSAYDYIVNLIYKTERIDKLHMTSSLHESHSLGMNISSGSGSISKGGLGVNLAIALSRMYSFSQTTSTLNLMDEFCFLHTIAVEIYDNKNDLVWQGESYWESQNVEIFNILASALQYIFCNLPLDDSIVPWADEVKVDHAANFFSLFCVKKKFICPALPYAILFRSPDETNLLGFPSSICNPEALAACIDLITTAEYAIPMGKFSSKNIMDEYLWERVQIGHQYLIGPENRKVHLLINMVGRREGYIIDKCWVASDDEFMEYQSKLLNWKIALDEYYNLYVR